MSDFESLIKSKLPWAYYRLGESAGVTADNAEGTSAYDGTYDNTPTLGATGAIAGDADTAVTFDQASDESVVLGGLGSLATSLNKGITIEAWVSFTNNNAMHVVSLYKTSPQYSVSLIVNGPDEGDGNVVMAAHGPDSLSATQNVLAYTAPAGIDDGAWHHIMGVLDFSNPATVHIYVDGEAQGVSYRSGYRDDMSDVTWQDFQYGSIADHAHPALDGFFDGSIDEVAIYARRLTAFDAFQNFQAGLGNFIFPQPGLPAINTGIAKTVFPGRTFGLPEYQRDAFVMQLLRRGLGGGVVIPWHLFIGRAA